MIERFIQSDNGTLTDHSVAVEDYHSGSTSMTLVAGEDALYVGSRYPFNAKYFRIDTANTQAATPTVAYWDGNEWREVVEIVDETASSGVPFAQSGYISWTPDRDHGWAFEDTTEDIPELSGMVVYDQYWIKITFDADVTTDIGWAGHLFCKDEDMGSEYPDLVRNNFKIAFEAGKTDWEEQRVRASRLLIDDLVNARVILTENQLLERREMRETCVNKTAVIIYTALGDDYTDDVDRAKKEYTGRLRKNVLSIDRNNNADLDRSEMSIRQGWLNR